MDLASTNAAGVGLDMLEFMALMTWVQTTVKDLASDKTTYPKLMGLDSGHAYATELVASPASTLMKLRTGEAVPGHTTLPCLLRRHMSYRTVGSMEEREYR
jgi:hypothetical protein